MAEADARHHGKPDHVTNQELRVAVAKVLAAMSDMEKRLNAKIVALGTAIDGLSHNLDALQEAFGTKEEVQRGNTLSEMILDKVEPGWRQRAPLI